MASSEGCYDYNHPVIVALPIFSLDGPSEMVKERGIVRLNEIKLLCVSLINCFVKINMTSLEFTKLLLGCDQQLWPRSLSRLEEYICDENFTSLESDEFWKLLFSAGDSTWKTIVFRSCNFHFSVDILPLFKTKEFWFCMADSSDRKWRALLLNLQSIDAEKFKFAFENDEFCRNLESFETWTLVQRRLSELLSFPRPEEFGQLSDFWDMIGGAADNAWNSYRMTLVFEPDQNTW